MMLTWTFDTFYAQLIFQTTILIFGTALTITLRSFKVSDLI